MGIFNKIFNIRKNLNDSEVEFKNFNDVMKAIKTGEFNGFIVEPLLNGRYRVISEEKAKENQEKAKKSQEYDEIASAMKNKRNNFMDGLNGYKNFSTTSNIVENNYTTNLKKTNQGSKRNNFINSLSN